MPVSSFQAKTNKPLPEVGKNGHSTPPVSPTWFNENDISLMNGLRKGQDNGQSLNDLDPNTIEEIEMQHPSVSSDPQSNHRYKQKQQPYTQQLNHMNRKAYLTEQSSSQSHTNPHQQRDQHNQHRNNRKNHHHKREQHQQQQHFQGHPQEQQQQSQRAAASPTSSPVKKRTKDDRQKSRNKKKKKGSTLSQWFCMSVKTDSLERNTKPPYHKPKTKGKQGDPKKGQGHQDPSKSVAGDKRKRHSAASTPDRNSRVDEVTQEDMALLDRQSEKRKEDLEKRYSDSGVSYRFDGTLERPYVYPGGLTFKSKSKIKEKKHKSTSWFWKGSKKSKAQKAGSKESITAEIHVRPHSSYVTEPSDQGYLEVYDHNDVRKLLYLKYDSNLKEAPEKNTSRDPEHDVYASIRKDATSPLTLSTFSRGDQTTCLSATHQPVGSGTSKHHPAEHRTDSKDGHQGQDSTTCSNIQPEECESLTKTGLPSTKSATISTTERCQDTLLMEAITKRRNRESFLPYACFMEARDSGRARTHYSRPIKNQVCVYMWHSCEDLHHCTSDYHVSSHDSRPFSMIDTSDGHHGWYLENNAISDPEKENSDAKHGLSSFGTTSDAQPDNLGKKIELHNGSENQLIVTTDSDIPFDMMRPKSHSFSGPSHTMELYDHDGVDIDNEPRLENSMFDNPFKRNMGRSSYMPGNKRFFLPPPPTYTPPREELEEAKAKLSKMSCSKGSQANLYEGHENLRNMEERDTSLTREAGQAASLELGKQVSKPDIPKKSSSRETQSKVISFCPDKTDNSSCRQKIDNVGISYHNFSPSRNVQRVSTEKSTSEQISTSKNCAITTAEVPTCSTPKLNRKDTRPDSVVEVTMRQKTKPVPYPRKKICSAMELSYNSDPCSTQSDNKCKSEVMDKFDSPASDTNANARVPPTPKKRRSQLLSSPGPYSQSDIEEGLRYSASPQSSLTRKDIAYHKNANSSHHQPSGSYPKGLTNSPPMIQSHDKTETNKSHPSDKSEKNSTNKSPDQMRSEVKVPNFDRPRHKKERSNKKKIGPLKEMKLAVSPSLGRRFSEFLDSSFCRPSPDQKCYYTGLSASLLDITDLFHRDVLTCSTCDANDDENFNADDEMSVHNDDLPLRKSLSVQDLPRTPSILNRAMMVTRRRRQRMRERKCRSHILSSTETDEGTDNRHSHSNRARSLDAFKPKYRSQIHNDSGHGSDLVSPSVSQEDPKLPEGEMKTGNTFSNDVTKPSTFVYNNQHTHRKHVDTKLRRKPPVKKGNSKENFVHTPHSHNSNVSLSNAKLETAV